MLRLSDLSLESLGIEETEEEEVVIEELDDQEIAIIGMSVRVPQANNLDEFWQNIQAGVDCTGNFPADRQAFADRFLDSIGATSERKYMEGGYLEGIDQFDAKFFRLLPTEASLMSPEQRLFLQCAWEALEDAGYGGKKAVGSRTGVYVGHVDDLGGYNYRQIITELDIEPALKPVSIPGNLAAIVASRISYLLDLHGPAMLIDTACSSSLVAVHTACTAIRSGDCEMAIAGGIRLNFIPLEKEDEKVGMESSDGKTRTFDHLSDGAAMGEGAAAVVLKPLHAAKRDGDPIYAVIKGSAINQDGLSGGITAPNVQAQTDVITRAWKNAGIDPETVSYIEAHGTGTRIGDPIEIDGLTRAFQRYTDRKQFVAIGSIKSNLGHLYQTAGVVSLIKTVLAMKNQKMPASLHFQRPNPNIKFYNSPLYVNNKLRKWETDQQPRRCGINSWGFSGTNAHVVVEEAPRLPQAMKTKGPYLLTLSAMTKTGLQTLVERYVQLFNEGTDATLEQICYTASTGRGHYSHRLALIAADKTTLLQHLLDWLREESDSDFIRYGEHKVVSDDKANKVSGEVTEAELRALQAEATSHFDQFRIQGQADATVLCAVADLYIKGADLDFRNLYPLRKIRTVHLPTYPFERSSYWVPFPSENKVRHQPVAVAVSAQAAEDATLYYATTWVERPFALRQRTAQQNGVLVFSSMNDMSLELVKRLRAGKRRVVEVTFGSAFQMLDTDYYMIRGEEEDYDRLLALFGQAELTQIIHLATMNDLEACHSLDSLNEAQERGTYSLFRLARALIHADVKHEIDILLVAQTVNQVSGDEWTLKPEQSPLLGLGKVVNQEHGLLSCRALDVDDQFGIEQLMAEVTHEKQEYLIAYRHGVRYTEQFGPCDLKATDERTLQVRDNGVYLITGGTGGLGLEVAKYLAEKAPVKLVLVNRSPLPPRALWDDLLQDEASGKYASIIRAIRAIEANGSEVIVFSCDVTQLESMKGMIENIRDMWGAIHGVVHCAGVAGDGFMSNKSPEVFDEVFLPKVNGTWVVDHLTEQDELDFFVLFSSGASLIGEAGQSDYCAANSYQDAYAAYRNRKGKRTLTINWVIWKDTGLGAAKGAHTKDGIYKTLPTAQAMRAFDEVMNREVSRVLVGELNVESNMLFLLESLPITLSPELTALVRSKRSDLNKHAEAQAGQAAVAEIKLDGRTDGDFSMIERQLANVYRSVLGLDEINIYDNFFELGGNSILLNMMFGQLQKLFPGQLKMTDLFAYTSISRLAEFLQEKTSAPKEQEHAKQEVAADDLSKLLEEIENGSISIDSAIELLK